MKKMRCLISEEMTPCSMFQDKTNILQQRKVQVVTNIANEEFTQN